ncbi:MAG: PadR family transcriptional regulator [Planctomycetota bacterium]
MSVPHTLLALLSDRPTHGYGLKTRFESGTADAWPLNVGQVYSTLSRLERDGLVQPDATKGDDQIWKITALGRRTLNEWFSTPVLGSPPSRNELAIKILIAVAAQRDDVTEIIRTQRTATMEQLQSYTRQKAEANRTDDLPRQLAIDAFILRAEAELRWLELCETRVRKRRKRKPS